VAFALGSILFNHLQRPEVVCVSVAISLALIFAFSDWPLKKGLTVAEHLGRFGALTLCCGGIGCLLGWYFWPRITVMPSKLTFHAYDARWTGEQYTVSVTNNINEDRYGVHVVFRVKSPEWSYVDFVCEPEAKTAFSLDSANGSVNVGDTPVGMGYENDTGFPILDVQIMRLKAHESRDIIFKRVKKPGEVSVSVSVADPGLEETPILTGGGK
jgi:hypothetical protein